MNDYTQEQQSDLYRRVIANQPSFLVKVGTYVLTDPNTRQLDFLKIDDIVNDVAYLHNKGKEVVMVTSGAIGAGRAASNYYDKGNLAINQALAAIGQPDLMGIYKAQFLKHGLKRGQIMLSYNDLIDPERKKNLKNSVYALQKIFSAIPILNENDPIATEEIQVQGSNGNDAMDYTSERSNFGDNDTLGAMAASDLDIKVLLMLSKEDGFLRNGNGSKFNVVYDISPLWEHVTDEKTEYTRGGMKSKFRATEIALRKGIYVIFLPGKEERVIRRMMEGEPLGTLFLPQKTLYIPGSN